MTLIIMLLAIIAAVLLFGREFVAEAIVGLLGYALIAVISAAVALIPMLAISSIGKPTSEGWAMLVGLIVFVWVFSSIVRLGGEISR